MSRIVARGKIRVDARKAIAKLREHLLVDLHDYLLEVARAAVASGAKRVDVYYDADDVWLSWNGKPIAPQTVTRLLDHVLIEAGDPEAQRLRLLALGVNAALGLSPAWIDVYAAARADGKLACTRVRFEPEMIDQERAEAGDADARQVEPPVGLKHGGVRVHVRRKLGWSVVRAAALGGTPREIDALAAATQDFPLPIYVQNTLWTRQAEHPVLLHAPLHLPPGTRRGFGKIRNAWIELRAHGYQSAHIQYLEQGVRLAAYDFAPDKYASATAFGCSLGVRVIVNADVLPTNASRSAVREDAELHEQVRQAANEAFEACVLALRHRVLGDGAPSKAVTFTEDATERRLDDLLGSLVVMATIPDATAESYLLSQAKVLFDGCGRRLSYDDIARDQAVFLYEGEEPLDPALSFWVKNVLWVRGRVAEQALSAYKREDATSVVRAAREALERREQFLLRDPVPISVPDADYLVRQAFDVSGKGRFAGLRGEVAVRREDSAATSLRIFFEDRLVATRNIPRTVVPLSLKIALAWDDRFSVSARFDDINDDEALKSAMWYAVTIAVGQVRKLAGKHRSGGDDVVLCRIIRAAIGALGVTRRALELPASLRPPPRRADPLWGAEAWPTTAGGFVTFAAIHRQAARAKCLCVATKRTRGRALDDRLVLSLGQQERRWLEAAVPSDVVLIDYDRGVFDKARLAKITKRRSARLRDEMKRELAQQNIDDTVILPFNSAGSRGLVAAAWESREVKLHLAERLSAGPLSRALSPAIVVADHADVVPTAAWDGVQWSAERFDLAAAQRHLFDVIIAAAEGDPGAIEHVGHVRSKLASSSLLRHFIIRGADGLSEIAEGEDLTLYDRVCSVPVVQMADADGKPQWVSLEQVALAHKGASQIDVLSEPVEFPTFEWKPLIVRYERERRALIEFFHPRLRHAERDQPLRRQRAMGEALKRRLLAFPQASPWELGDLSTTKIHGDVELQGDTACVGVPSQPLAGGAAVIDVMYRDHLVFRTRVEASPYPVVARVGLTDHELFRDEHSLNERGTRRVGLLAAAGAAQMAFEFVQADAAEGAATLSDPRVVSVIVAALSRRKVDNLDLLRLRNGLRYTAKFPSVQGEYLPLKNFRRGGEIQFGRRLFTPWHGAKRGRSPLDDPVMWIDDEVLGKALRFILTDLKIDLRGVSSALARLQARRGGSADDDAPKLDGAPLAKPLRAAFDKLGDTSMAGEIELIAGIRSMLTMVDVEGTSHVVEGEEIPFGVRVVARVDELYNAQTSARFVRRVHFAARKLMTRAGEAIDQLPTWVRDNYRANLAAYLKRDRRLTKKEKAVPVFREIRGEWLSTADVLASVDSGAHNQVWFTTVMGLYPKRDYERPVLVLHEQEAELFRGYLRLRNMSKTLERDIEAQKRRTAKRVDTFELTAEQRKKCQWTQVISDDGLRGEIGVLNPEAKEDRGVTIHVGGRKLCFRDDHLVDQAAWPIVASIDSDTIEPNRFFDGPKRRGQLDKLIVRLRHAANALLTRSIPAPAYAVMNRWVDHSHEGTVVVGRLWFGETFAREPFVHVRAPQLLGDGTSVRLRRLFGPPRMDHSIPIYGSLMISPASTGTDLHAALAGIAFDKAVDMVAEMMDRGTATADIDVTRWSLALLGAELDPPPTVPVADGTQRGPRQIVVEMKRRGELWVTDRRGSADGAFPGTARKPSFVLPSKGPLYELLTLRAPAIVRHLGGVAVDEPPKSGRSVPTSEEAPIAAYDLDPAVDPDAAVEQSWFDGLKAKIVRSVLLLPEPAPATLALAHTLHSALSELDLPRNALIVDVKFSRSGRPLRWNGELQRIVVNRDHPAIRELLPAHEEPTPTSLLLLKAAVVSEMNRAHGAVTVAEEQNILLTLLGAKVKA